MMALRKYTPPTINVITVCPLNILADSLPENMIGIEFDPDEEFEELD